MEQTFKLLKITDTKGNMKHVPHLRENVRFYEDHKKNILASKRELYKIETVELSVEEAAAIGVAEAYRILHPRKKAAPVANNNEVMLKMMEQNQELMERLAVLESKEKTPTKK